MAGIGQKFTGQERDSEATLNYFNARYYASVQGRFVSVDPLMRSASIDDPQSFDRYSYVLNNPLNDTEPSGLCPKGQVQPNVPLKKFSITDFMPEGAAKD